MLDIIKNFIAQKNIAIVGVSRNKSKMGYLIYNLLKTQNYTVFPVNPSIDFIDENKVYNNINLIEESIDAVIICTKPEITINILKESIHKNIKNIWIQKGAENSEIIDYIKENNLNVVYEKCIFMFIEPVKGVHSFHRFLTKLFGKYPQ